MSTDHDRAYAAYRRGAYRTSMLRRRASDHAVVALALVAASATVAGLRVAGVLPVWSAVLNVVLGVGSMVAYLDACRASREADADRTAAFSVQVWVVAALAFLGPLIPTTPDVEASVLGMVLAGYLVAGALTTRALARYHTNYCRGVDTP